MPDLRAIVQEAVRTRQFGPAEQTFLRIIRSDPANAEAWQWLGVCLRMQGRAPEAVQANQKAVQMRPRSVPALVELGLSLHQNHRIEDAMSAYQQALSIQPDNPVAMMHLGRAHLDQFNPTEAIRLLKESLKKQPANIDGQSLLAQAFLARGLPKESVKILRGVLQARPNNAPLMCMMAAALRLAGEDDEALSLLEQAGSIQPGLSGPIAGQAQILESRREYAKADALVAAAVRRGMRTPDIAEAFARQAKRTERQQEAIDFIHQTLESAGTSLQPYTRSMLLMNLGDLLETQKRFSEAFAAYKASNDLYPQTFTAEGHNSTINQLLEAYSADRFATLARSTCDSELPVYIVGMPRSGTSLVEQILASHPSVFGAGELNDLATMQLTAHRRFGFADRHPQNAGDFTTEILNQLANEELENLRGRADQTEGTSRTSPLLRVTDKMPGNYYNIGFAARLFPRTRVIYCRRHPMDNCLSCYTTALSPLHSYSNNLLNLAVAYRTHLRVMEHWKTLAPVPIMEVRYESLVENPEPIVRAMLEFLDLPWDGACMRHHETRRVVHTASMDQARKPIYRSSVARWKHYESELQPLREALGEVVDQWEAEQSRV